MRTRAIGANNERCAWVAASVAPVKRWLLDGESRKPAGTHGDEQRSRRQAGAQRAPGPWVLAARRFAAPAPSPPRPQARRSLRAAGGDCPRPRLPPRRAWHDRRRSTAAARDRGGEAAPRRPAPPPPPPQGRQPRRAVDGDRPLPRLRRVVRGANRRRSVPARRRQARPGEHIGSYFCVFFSTQYIRTDLQWTERRTVGYRKQPLFQHHPLALRHVAGGGAVSLATCPRRPTAATRNNARLAVGGRRPHDPATAVHAAGRGGSVLSYAPDAARTGTADDDDGGATTAAVRRKHAARRAVVGVVVGAPTGTRVRAV